MRAEARLAPEAADRVPSIGGDGPGADVPRAETSELEYARGVIVPCAGLAPKPCPDGVNRLIGDT